MAVAKVVHTVCDLCGGDKEVNPVTVKIEDRMWELDVCSKCYKSRFSDLERIGRKPARKRRKAYTVVEPL